MTDDDGTATEESDPAEVFALLGNEVRATILATLGEEPHAGLSFSELRSRVDPGIDSGRFNYHLGELVGQFVDQDDDGYRLRPEGLTLYRAIRAGSYNRRPTGGPFPARFDCHFCGTGVEAGFEDGYFEITCPGCDHVYGHTILPPNAVEGDESELLARIDGYVRHRLRAYDRGVCPTCVNDLDVSMVPAEAVWVDGSERLDVFVNHDCDHCGASHYVSVGAALLDHPAVVSFFHDHGVDLRAVPHWELEFAMTDHHTTVRSEDPWEVALTLTLDDETLELVVDGDLTVTAEHRRDVGGDSTVSR